MDEKNFKAFIEILRMIKKRDSEKSSIEETIIDLIEHYERELTEEQKARVLKDLVSYERKRRQKKSDRKIETTRDYF